MALPYNAIAVDVLSAAYLAPDVRDKLAAVSLELGGVAINDGSQGREVRVWRARISDDGTQVLVEPEDESIAPLVFVTDAGITECSLAFDSNMQPTVAYVAAGLVKLRWFSTIAGTFTTTSYAGASSPRVCTDDKRLAQFTASDVIFAYVRDGVLYWRQQRDRYTVERQVGPALYPLRRVGMNAERRLQFELTPEGAA